MPEDVAVHLARVFAGQRETAPRCYFAVWEGWGPPALFFGTAPDCPEEIVRHRIDEASRDADVWRVLLDSAPRFAMPDRPMRLLEGPLGAVAEFYTAGRQPPSLWWPQEHQWCVAGDVDLMTSYVGASRDCVEALLSREGIEVLAVPPDQAVTWDSDRLNPLPGPPR